MLRKHSTIELHPSPRCGLFLIRAKESSGGRWVYAAVYTPQIDPSHSHHTKASHGILVSNLSVFHHIVSGLIVPYTPVIHRMIGASFFSLLLLPNKTGANWAMMGDAEMTQDSRQTESGIRCVGHWGGDTQLPHCFFSLLFSSFTLLLSLFFKALLLYSSLKSCF
jgi:hypothetical protein